LLPRTAVVGVDISDGRVAGVQTTQGPIQSPIVVDAAGAWSRQVAELSGIYVPLVPTRQQLIVSESIEGAHAGLPMVRIMDAAVYMRPCQGGFLWGVYEENPRFFDMNDFGASFDIRDMPLDIKVLQHAADDVKAQLPILQTAKVHEFRGGLPTMTADGNHILGPAPDAKGFFFASGCNVAGLSISPAIGEALAAWIVDGKPPIDLSALSIERFRDTTSSEEQLRRQAAWQYRHFYGAV
jgi:glycine/D-amino acid oxidase-like deaminating enzyme